MSSGSEHNAKYFKNTKLIGILGTVIGLSITFLMLPMGITIILASIIFMILSGRMEAPVYTNIKKNNLLYLNIIFFALLLINAVIIYQNSYERPPIFFVIISIMFTIIGMEVLFYLTHKKIQTHFILLKILLLSFMIYISVLLTSKSFIGVDIWYHRDIILEILKIAHIPDVGRYSYFPIYHITTSLTSIITDLNLKKSIIFSIGTIYSFSLIFIYLLGKKVYSNQFGLLCTLLIAFTSYHIQRGYWLIPQSLGIALFIIILYLLIKKIDSNPIFTYILILYVVLLNMTHNLSVMISFSIIAVFYCCTHIYNRIYEKNVNQINNNFLLFFFIFMLAYWTYVYSIYPYFAHVFAHDMTLESVVNVSYSTSTLIINQFGFLVLVFLAVIGAFYVISKKRMSNINYSLVSTPFLILIFIQILRLANVSAIVPQRWIAFVSILFVLPASFGIIFIRNSIISYKKIYIVTILILFSFFMLTSTVANNDSPIYSENQTERFGLYDSEIKSAHTINNFHVGDMSTDLVYKLYFHYYLENNKITSLNNESKTIILRKSLFQNDEYYKNFRNYDLKQYKFADCVNYFKIYESNTVEAYSFTTSKKEK